MLLGFWRRYSISSQNLVRFWVYLTSSSFERVCQGKACYSSANDDHLECSFFLCCSVHLEDPAKVDANTTVKEARGVQIQEGTIILLWPGYGR